MARSRTNEQILRVAREILAAEGFGAVSFDAIARRLGRSKQAVLYWYPTKHDLLAAMFLPWLEAEAGVVAEALAAVTGRDAAVAAFVRAVARFHIDDLDRFRMMYLVPQTTGARGLEPGRPGPVERVHPVTDRLYGALASHLEPARGEPRAQALAIHAAVIGLMTMLALADTLHDPLKHSEAALVDALVASLTAG